jgi:hypothetical protein
MAGEVQKQAVILAEQQPWVFAIISGVDSVRLLVRSNALINAPVRWRLRSVNRRRAARSPRLALSGGARLATDAAGRCRRARRCSGRAIPAGRQGRPRGRRRKVSVRGCRLGGPRRR